MLHPGSHVNAGEQAGIAQIVKGLNTVLNQNDDDVFIALETMAGKGSEIGRSFEELKAIYDGVDRKERLRVCFDTCHVNDAGFWLVGTFLEIDEKTTLKSWTIMETLIGVTALIVSLVISIFA